MAATSYDATNDPEHTHTNPYSTYWNIVLGSSSPFSSNKFRVVRASIVSPALDIAIMSHAIAVADALRRQSLIVPINLSWPSKHCHKSIWRRCALKYRLLMCPISPALGVTTAIERHVDEHTAWSKRHGDRCSSRFPSSLLVSCCSVSVRGGKSPAHYRHIFYLMTERAATDQQPIENVNLHTNYAACRTIIGHDNVAKSA